MLFVPLARYKIVLIPVFSVCAAYYIYYLSRLIQLEDRNLLVRPLLIFFSALVFSGLFCGKLPERQSDIRAYGVTASYIPHKLMSKGKFTEAKKILERYYLEDKTNPYIMLNYASSLLGAREAKKAHGILKAHHTIKEPALIGRYFYELAECSYMLNDKPRAFQYYRMAISYPISETRSELAKSRIKLLIKEEKRKNQ